MDPNSDLRDKISYIEDEIERLTEDLRVLKGELERKEIQDDLNNSLRDPKLSSRRILWTLCKFPYGTKHPNLAVWVDPRKLIDARIMIHAILYVKYIATFNQAEGIYRVVMTLLYWIGVKSVEVRHHPGRVTSDSALYRVCRKLEEELRQRGHARRLRWNRKERNEFHMRELHLFNEADEKLLSIFCDRDFNDIGHPYEGSKEVHFLYYKQDSGDPAEPYWKKGIHLTLTEGITGCDISKFLQVVPKTELHFAKSIEVCFLHIRQISQWQEMSQILKFFVEQDVETVNITTLLRSDVYENKNWDSETKRTKDVEDKALNKSYADEQQRKLENKIDIKFEYTARHLSHLSCIKSLDTNLMIVSDEGLQMHKKDDEHLLTISQRTRAFSMFILLDYLGKTPIVQVPSHVEVPVPLINSSVRPNVIHDQ